MQTIDDETARIIKVVAIQLEIDPSRICETDHLVEDLDADSLTLVSVLAALEFWLTRVAVTIPSAGCCDASQWTGYCNAARE